jgi:hypothetical protein
MSALAILLIASIGILAMTAVSITTTENQGHLGARTAEYAQDKMEQLQSLAFSDGQAGAGNGTDTTVASFTATTTGGNGLYAGGSVTYGSAAAGMSTTWMRMEIPSAAAIPRPPAGSMCACGRLQTMPQGS